MGVERLNSIGRLPQSTSPGYQFSIKLYIDLHVIYLVNMIVWKLQILLAKIV